MFSLRQSSCFFGLRVVDQIHHCVYIVVISLRPHYEILIAIIFIFFSYLNSEQASSALFFQYNTQLGPPYRVLVDTNFINFSIQHKLDIFQAMVDCLYAKCEFTLITLFGELVLD